MHPRARPGGGWGGVFPRQSRRNYKGMRQPTTNMENTWHTPGRPEGKGNHVQKTVGRILEEIEQWRENSSMDDTLTSLTSIETFLEETKEMNFAILREEEDAAIPLHTEFVDQED